jgi:hypothetical protein
MSDERHVIIPLASRAAVRAIFAGLVMFAASTALVPTAQAQSPVGVEGRQAHLQAPVGHRQPTRADVTAGSQAHSDKQSSAQDNERLGLSPSEDPVPDADQIQSEENSVAKTIEEENDRLDRLVKGICRGC